jgi:hypothetical protein
MKLMLSYPIDLDKPYTILYPNDDATYTVCGIARTLHCHISERAVDFGGYPSIFVLSKNGFLTKAQKARLRWIKKHLGVKQHDLLENKLYDLAIASHTTNPD